MMVAYENKAHPGSRAVGMVENISPGTIAKIKTDFERLTLCPDSGKYCAVPGAEVEFMLTKPKGAALAGMPSEAMKR